MSSLSRTAVVPVPSTRLSKLLRVFIGDADVAVADDVPQAKKPANLVYGVGEHPPVPVAFVMALQHVFVLSVGWIFVVVLVSAIGGSTEQSQAIIRISMIASGAATILQARKAGPVGSGFLCPVSCGPAYLSAAILAGKTGGLPLLFGMTTISGVFESALSRAIHRLRALFPPEVTGLVVAMVGIELIGMSCTRFLGYNNGSANGASLIVGIVTLTAMVVPTVSKTRLRLYPVLLGITAGYVSSIALGLLTIHRVREALEVPLLGLPHRPPDAGWTFSFALLAPFLIASLSSTLKTVGDITLCQKINDAEWKRTDMKSVSGGILAGSLCTTAAGFLGGMGQTTFSSNVGLSMATGVTSRVVAVPAGLILIALAFFPKLAAFFAVIPPPVMGAVLVYVACFMILGGLQVLTSRMLDSRRIFVVGLALIFGLSVEMAPGLYRQVPNALRPLFSSSLALTTVLVVALNMLFRIGVARTRHATLLPQSDGWESIFRLMDEQGAAWGMRKEVCSRVMDGLDECLAVVNALGVTSPVSLRLRFDEIKLVAVLEYQGPALPMPNAPPTADDLVNSKASMAELSAYMLRQHVDRIRIRRIEGGCRVFLYFEH